MDEKELLIRNVDRICQEKKWKRRDLAKKMGAMEESLSRSLNGNPSLRTLSKIAKALDVSIKSLFDDPDAIEGFVSVRGKVHRINSKEEFEKVVKDSRPILNITISS